MASKPTAFDTLMQGQKRQVALSAVPTLEHVAASVTRVAGFGNAGTGASGHEVPVDEPAVFGGGGTAADPAELLLIAVGASLSVTVTVHASLAGVAIDAVDIVLSGDLDAGRFFEPSDEPGAGFIGITLAVAIQSPAPPSAVRDVLAAALLASPVLRSLTVTPVTSLNVNGNAA